MPTPDAIRIAVDARRTLASDALTGRQAKLFSQRVRRDMGQPGLATFSPADVGGYLEEAMWLIDCALTERSAEPRGHWRRGVRRAADILEFLSQHDLRPAGSPVHMLAAAAYQVSGFPAMALSQLERLPPGEPVSLLVRDFLRADFPAALEEAREFWRAEGLASTPEDAMNLSTFAVQHTVMCVGTLCMYFKTGDRRFVDRALQKLHALAQGYLHSRDAYSYLLARLTAMAADSFEASSLWNTIKPLTAAADDDLRAAFQQFARSAFINCRSVIWPAQAVGIARLAEPSSFVLCTPTGSGKTMVATLAVVQGLFRRPVRPLGLEHFEPDNLILYIVPSRALAAEVERRFAQDLHGIAATPVIVTGLYGGIDWGPTDAWIQTDSPTIVICTFEKADALLRYLGVLFLHRVRLVVIDEAHMVEMPGDFLATSASDTSRELRLELLATRLIEAREHYGFRIIALSAVAAAAAPALARWIGGTPDAVPVTSAHRSTRQMVGRIEVSARGRFSIRYDLMDGRSLRFEDQQAEQIPFVPTPFPQMPVPPDFSQPEKAMQATALWAAIHLAAERPDGSRPSVLISVTQSIGSFASECVSRLREWPTDQLPAYRDDAIEQEPLWRRCLATAADYFGTDSVEYRLLQRGIAVHHGKMPGLLTRRLKLLMDRGHVRVIIATSTLSEGVNIPVTYLLIPSVYRATARLSPQEFANLIGRAGRPGVSTEGHALVLLPKRQAMPFSRGRWRTSRQRLGYASLVEELSRPSTTGAGEFTTDAASSPLSRLLVAIEENWRRLVDGGAGPQLAEWLEQTSVTPEATTNVSPAVECLDTLDSFLLAAIHELEQLRGEEIPPADVEEQLANIWQRSYAFAAAREEERLRGIWLGRGRAIKTLYPDPAARRKIYRTSLSPRSALTLIARVDAIREALVAGADYVARDTNDRLEFIGDILQLLSEIPSFQISTRLGRRKGFGGWRQVLRWWLAKETLDRQPSPAQVTVWYGFASQNFIYRGAWGLGSVLSLLLDVAEDGQPIAAIEIDDWPRSGLPWIAFWLKELLLWGTLEPVAAFLLARGNAVDRPSAHREADGYYEQLTGALDPNERLDPRRIRDWLDSRDGGVDVPRPPTDVVFDAALSDEVAAFLDPNLHVMHFEVKGRLNWIDGAGYLVATSRKPPDWPNEPEKYTFELDVERARVRGTPYLRHV
ncbi:MAG: DEAD/DEAH box helicase [Acidobacteria bacterium]|nr:DEAD/DEAH box helicase [Acidobacteriota bacterium]